MLFSYSKLKMYHFLLTIMVSHEKLMIIEIIILLYVICHFSFIAFKDFYLTLVFRSLITMYLGIGFFGLVLFWVCSASWIYSFVLFTKLREFRAITSSNIFWPYILSPLLQESSDTYVSPFVVVSQVPKAPSIFFSVVQIGSFLLIYHQVHWLSSVISFLLLGPSSKIFFSFFSYFIFQF